MAITSTERNNTRRNRTCTGSSAEHATGFELIAVDFKKFLTVPTATWSRGGKPGRAMSGLMLGHQGLGMIGLAVIVVAQLSSFRWQPSNGSCRPLC